MKKTIFTLIICFCPFFMIGEGIQKKEALATPDSFILNFEKQLELFPHEKLYLHIDRDYYIPGDKIWFKGYLLDAQTHLSTAESRYIYVELIDLNGTLINRVMIRPDEQYSYLFHGHIFLSDIIPSGEYTIRAYTRYMENIGDDYFFKRIIRIGNISATNQTISKQNITENKREDFAVSFFPEGGQLLTGVPNRIAFKSMNNLGYSEYITGDIVDEENNFIVSLNTFHLGMGVFSLIPENGKKYFAVCKNSDNKEKKFELPQAISNSLSLFANWRNGKLNISLTDNNPSLDQPTYIFIHARGNVIYFNEWGKSSKTLAIQEEQLPAGIIQIVLFDSTMNPISERLVFCKNEQLAKTTIETDKERYKMREKVSVTVNTTNKNERPIEANLSVSVTDERDVALDESQSILSSLLLSSELRGHIESPGLYFVEDTEETRYALDCLMMTQGWRRYDLSRVTQGKIEKPKVEPEVSMEINGKVLHQILSRPVSHSEVILLATESADLFQTTTNENGIFKFEEIEFQDKMPFLIQSFSATGKDNVRLQVNDLLYPNPKPMLPNNPKPDYIFSNKTSDDSKDETFLLKAEERYKYDDDIRIMHLETIEFVASRINRKSEKLSIYAGSAAHSLTSQTIEEYNPISIHEVLRVIPGIEIIPSGGIRIQGRSGNPAIFIDDVLVIEGTPESSVFNGTNSDSNNETISGSISEEFELVLTTINVHDIERIDIFKGAEAAIFGTMGGSGVISITSKRGNNIAPPTKEALNRLSITPFGYQEAVEFYSPVYDTEAKKFNVTPDLRTTIYWKPDLIIPKSGEIMFDFYTADYTTNYTILIEGVTSLGDIIRTVKRIKVD